MKKGTIILLELFFNPGMKPPIIQQTRFAPNIKPIKPATANQSIIHNPINIQIRCLGDGMK